MKLDGSEALFELHEPRGLSVIGGVDLTGDRITWVAGGRARRFLVAGSSTEGDAFKFVDEVGVTRTLRPLTLEAFNARAPRGQLAKSMRELVECFWAEVDAQG